MSVEAIKAFEPYFVPILTGATLSLFVALMAGLIIGIRSRKRFLVQAAEELLATPQFAAAARVEGDKAIRSVAFQEAVQRAVRDDVRTQSGIIDVVVTSAEVREMIDQRVKHGQINHDYAIDGRIRAAQEATRQEFIKTADRLEAKMDHVVQLLVEHINQSRGS